jgi:formylglycine-generating enzyme required for sulfatase activity
VGAYPDGASPYGCLDMASSNGTEWTSSKWSNYWEKDRKPYFGYPYDSDDGREEPEGDSDRVLRGGSRLSPERWGRCAHRGGNAPDLTPYSGGGFRCVRSP